MIICIPLALFLKKPTQPPGARSAVDRRTLKMPPTSFRIALSLLAPLLVAAGCTLGPDFHGAPPVAARGVSGTGVQARLQDGVSATAPAAATWWESLGDPQLNHLIETALGQQPRSSRRRSAPAPVSRAGLRQQKSNELPKIGGTAVYLHAAAARQPARV